MTGEQPVTAFVYSACWPVLQALSDLCCGKNNREHSGGMAGHTRLFSSEGELLREINRETPQILVLDISLRSRWPLLNNIRGTHPALPVVITQSRFLFSDRVVAECFGHIWLKEYGAVLAGYPQVSLADHLRLNAQATTAWGGGELSGQKCDGEVYGHLVQRLRERLYDLLGSPRLCEVVMNWLSTGMSPAEVGASVRRSAKLVYHYRGQVMRALNIHHCAKDFIPSLTVAPTTENV